MPFQNLFQKIRHFRAFVAIFILLTACSSPSEKSFDLRQLSGSGLAIATISPDFSSSTLYFQSLENGFPDGKIKTLLTGESSIPWPIVLDHTLYFFNRSITSSNFRVLDFGMDSLIAKSQQRTPLAGVGDPHAAITLDKHHLLLAHYSSGTLVVVDTKTGSFEEFKAPWDLGDDAKNNIFRPEALYRNDSIDGTTRIYVLHQPRSRDFVTFNKTQQLFVLEWKDSVIKVIDQNPNQEGIQGIPLHLFNPQIIVPGQDLDQLLIAGFCTIFDSASDCVSGVEVVDLVNAQSTMLYDLSHITEKGNGPIIAGPPGIFYASLGRKEPSGEIKSSLFQINPLENKYSEFYSFEDRNYAAYALAYSSEDQHLYVGEKLADGTGAVKIFDLKSKNKGVLSFSLEAPPSEFALIKSTTRPLKGAGL